MIAITLELVWLLVTGWTIADALLRKTSATSAWGWIAISLLFPLGGPALYALFGINRVQTRARRRGMPKSHHGSVIGVEHESDARPRRHRLGRIAVPSDLSEVARTGDVMTHWPLLDHNRLELLHNGEQAYPRMIAAIDAATSSVALMTYIFECDSVGQQFIEALVRAQKRGVAVRCLIDGIGELGWPRASTLLAACGIPIARFNPLRLWPPFLHANLRNHRKLLIVDGALAYAGGMNLSLHHLVESPENPHPTVDLHVELRGPVLRQLFQVFLDDWAYAHGAPWTPPTATLDAANADIKTALAPLTPDDDNVADRTICRVITDGPNEDYGHLTMVLLAAIAAARQRIQIITPYFLPPEELLTALLSAALRGVTVDVILSSDSDHKLTDWATGKLLPRLLQRGVRVYYQPPPFCHTKLLVIDGHYAQFGSANLDARSLRLNFELMVEVYDDSFAGRLAEHCEALRLKARRVTLEERRKQPLVFRLRDAACWLFSPYL